MTQRTINLYDGLEALYYLDSDYFDSGANELKDKSGYGRHAEARGGPTVGVEGPASFEAASFDGSDDYFQLFESYNRQEKTVSALFLSRQRGGTASDRGSLFTNQDSGGDENFNLGQNSDLYFSGNDDSAARFTNFKEDLWYHVTGYWDGEQNVIVVNGEVKDVVATTQTAPSSNRSATIGVNKRNNNNYIDGRLAYVGYWSRALRMAEIEYLHSWTGPRRAML